MDTKKEKQLYKKYYALKGQNEKIMMLTKVLRMLEEIREAVSEVNRITLIENHVKEIKKMINEIVEV